MITILLAALLTVGNGPHYHISCAVNYTPIAYQTFDRESGKLEDYNEEDYRVPCKVTKTTAKGEETVEKVEDVVSAHPCKFREAIDAAKEWIDKTTERYTGKKPGKK